MTLQARYERLRHVSRLDEARASEIVEAARPHAAALLPSLASPDDLRVTARCVAPANVTGGSLIPAWPRLNEDGSATIEFVADWGVLLAGWAEAAGPTDGAPIDLDALIQRGDRLWVGIANDVLQMFVPNPPAGTYSMVRHHALMLGAATIWLGRERMREWWQAHTLAARAFLRRSHDAGTPLWDAVTAAERGLATLLADPRAGGVPADALQWLDSDPASAAAYQQFHGAASLGIAALLCTAPDQDDLTDWLRDLVHNQHPHPDFNRDRIAAFAQAAAGQ